MKILLDLTHPAHVHFFRNPIKIWQEQGHQIAITAREKDIATELLDSYGWPYTVLSKTGHGLVGLGKELIFRNMKLFNVVRKFKPDVMVAIGGIYIAQVGKLLGVPSAVFTDTENATLQNKLTFPFATKIITPTCYETPVPKDKHLTYPGYHELSYTHPKQFTPDPAVLEKFNLKEDEPFTLVRLVSWGAHHDVHDHGFTHIQEAIQKLKQFGKVLISAEGELPPELEPDRVSIHPELVHHLLYYAQLFVGESATMASESATLGTPAIFISTSTRGYTNEQEAKYGIVWTFSDPEKAQQQGLDKAFEILEAGKNKEFWAAKRQEILNDKTDVAEYIAKVVLEIVNSK